MPVRVCISPVVTTGNGARQALVAQLIDPGRPASQAEDDNGSPITVPKHLVCVAAIGDGAGGQRNSDCLAIVAGINLINLDSATGVTNLFEAGSDQPLAGFRNWLTSTPNGLSWNAAKRTRILNRLTSVGASATGLTATAPLWQIVNRLGAVWEPSFDVRTIRTVVQGA